jgi:glycosyltransferase involved in cell wall biosynthesis
MKVLQFSSYITISGYKQFSRNITGFGYMTIDIATSIATQRVEVDLLTQGNITKKLEYKNVNILSHTWWDIFSNFKISDLWEAIIVIISNRVPFKKTPNYILYYISMGYFETILKNKAYDLVHIHGIGPATTPVITSCNKFGVRYLVTLHGLNSFSKSINVSENHRLIEKNFLGHAEKEKITVTVISTGIRRQILNYLSLSGSTNFAVVPNGCDTSPKRTSSKIDIRERYNISNNQLILLCVGNISTNKNQIQIVRSYKLLPQNIQKLVVVLFIGNDTTNGKFEDFIKEFGHGSNLICCGCIPKNEVGIYYSQADFNIVASISEGFGLPIIEGFTYGLPCLAYSDLDAVPDLFHNKAMYLINDRTDEAMASGITELVNGIWDKGFIQQHAQNFSLENMAERYINVYENILNESNG